MHDVDDVSVDVSLGCTGVGVAHDLLNGCNVVGAGSFLEPSHGVSAERVAAAVIGFEVSANFGAGRYVNASLACWCPAMMVVVAIWVLE